MGGFWQDAQKIRNKKWGSSVARPPRAPPSAEALGIM